LLAWLVPPGALLLGVGVVIVALRYMRDPTRFEAEVEQELSAEDETRLREALREMDAAEEPIF
jgi:cytochrome c-type biogenesis protein CcmH/NrfF